jgi:hypothetical protein
MKLANDTDRLPEIGDAIRRGALDEMAAMLVARVATPRTVSAWIERARARTYKHLREEVELVETRGRMEGVARGADAAPMPPTDAEVAAFFALERAMLSGELVREALTEGGVRMCHHSVKALGAPGRREIRLRVPEEVFVEFRMMEVAFERAGLPGEFLSFVCRTFWFVWGPALGVSDKWEAIYRRDRYRCTCPVCLRRDVTLHHLTYRSAGGGDEPENLATLCAACHIEGEHEGRLKVRPPASRPRWELGRRGREPVMVVVGRERR